MSQLCFNKKNMFEKPFVVESPQLLGRASCWGICQMWELFLLPNSWLSWFAKLSNSKF